MKILVNLIFCAALLIGPSHAIAAQDYVPTPVTISKEKVKLHGKVYYSHVVLEKQTLYSIAKAYRVSVEDILEANPSVAQNGLQKNAIIMIPVAAQAPETASEQSEAQETKATESKDTKASESKPQESKAAAETENPTDKVHIVKWFEDINDISKKYGIPANDILEYNGLKSKKLSRQQRLLIPAAPIERKPAEVEEKATEEDETLPVEENSSEVADSSRNFFSSFLDKIWGNDGNREIEAALVLPFHENGKVVERNMDFYSGVLMAMQDLKSKDVKVKLNVYDLSAGAMPQGNEDIIIGPVTPSDILKVRGQIHPHAPIVSPLDQKVRATADTLSGMIQLPPDSRTQYSDLVKWAASNKKASDKIILLTEKGNKNSYAEQHIRHAIAASQVECESFSYSLVEGRDIPPVLEARLVKDAKNLIILASESEVFFGDAMRNMGIMISKGYDIELYAPSKVRNFDTVESSALHSVNLHISTSYFVDYSDERVKSFLLAYRAYFNTEPTQFTFQGYDTAMYLFKAAAKNGKDWIHRLPQEESKGLHINMKFEANSAGSYINTGIRRTVYSPDGRTILE